MSDAHGRQGGSSRGPWLPVLALLLPVVVVPLWVPLYNREDPTLLGFPFYFWFQLALIPVAVVLTVSAYALARDADRRARVEHGLPADPPGDPDAGPRGTKGDRA